MPIPLPNDGDLLIPRRPGLTEKSRLSPSGMIGSHRGSPTCNGGVIFFYPLASGWVVACNKCVFRFEIPREPEEGGGWDYAALRKVCIRACADAATKGDAK